MLEIKSCPKQPPLKVSPNPKFGTAFTPHLLQIDIDETNGSWNPSAGIVQAKIKPLNDGEIFKATTLVFHYGQSIFEGLKAFKSESSNQIGVFRLGLHAKRFMESAKRMAMPVIGEEIFVKSVLAQVDFERESIPDFKDHALYIRPLMFARDEIVKVGRGKKYSFYVLTCVVGSYFPGGATRPAKVLVSPEFVRATKGGLGEAKTAANYAASLAPQAFAESLGCDQVLYLDGVHHENIDELGGMNFFVVQNGELITPSLNGAILNGVTRRSILEIAQALGLNAREASLPWSQVKEGIRSSAITEAFACGTAAVIQPINEFLFQKDHLSQPESVKLHGPAQVSERLRKLLTEIQRGQSSSKLYSSWLDLV